MVQNRGGSRSALACKLVANYVDNGHGNYCYWRAGFPKDSRRSDRPGLLDAGRVYTAVVAE